MPTLTCVTDPAGVAAALADYGALESAGWKAGTGTAIHPDNAQGRFYRRMLEAFCTAILAGRSRAKGRKETVEIPGPPPLISQLATVPARTYHPALSGAGRRFSGPKERTLVEGPVIKVTASLR